MCSRPVLEIARRLDFRTCTGEGVNVMHAVADRYVLLPQHERAGGAVKVVKALDTEKDGSTSR
jgi:hypothetical protein